MEMENKERVITESKYRIEEKYTMASDDANLLEGRISRFLQPDMHSEGEYKISSLYFDDYNMSSFHDSLDGNPQRRKYRIRIYNDSLECIKLEVKVKNYNKGYKLSSQISKDEMRKLISGEIILDSGRMDDSRTLFNLAIKTRNIRPVVIINYFRKAYMYAIGTTRITFDQMIGYSGFVENYGRKEAYRLLNLETIMELKYTEVLPVFIREIVENEKMIRVSNSKYALCVEGMGE